MKVFNLFFAFLFITLSLSAQKNKISAKRPNIIFILTDDHRWDALGAMGNSIIHTPNLDKLAANGILFKNAYVTTAICAVSRASILTGQYLSRHGINSFGKNLSPQSLQQTYPKLLKDAGYRTAFVGKFGIGNTPPTNIFNYLVTTDPKSGGQPPYIVKDKNGNEIHDTDTISNAVLKFLTEEGGKSPFCLSISFKAPHELDGSPPTYVVQQRFKELYSNVKITEPFTAAPEYVKLLPPFLQTESNIARKRWHGLLGTPQLYQENVKNYYRLITGVDETVGKLRQKLSQLKLEKNTVIIFMGDNGMLLGEHGMEGKWYGYEQSIRVPLIVYSPNLPFSLKGIKSPNMVLNIDIAPTILALAGIKQPDSMQGVDVFSVLQGKMPKREDFFYQHYHLGKPLIPQVEGVVTTRFKYMNYIEFGYEELYDISNDPHEIYNLANDTIYRRQLDSLRHRRIVLKQSLL